MNSWARRVLLGGLAIGLWLLPAVSWAEVAHDPVFGTIILGTITDGPDPIGQIIWQPHRSIAPEQILNAGGYDRSDGRPDIFWKGDSWPVVVWAYNLGADHDIAISEWDGSAWTATEFITAGVDDDLDPRVFIELDGTAHVVWWTAGAVDAVFFSTRAAGGGEWSVPEQVSGAGESARRPSVVVAGAELKISYERGSTEPGMVQDIVVATRSRPGSYSVDVVGSTIRSGELSTMLHVVNGTLWVDWMHEESNFGCSEKEGADWSPVLTAPWDDHSWVGIEEMRKVIQSLVLGN